MYFDTVNIEPYILEYIYIFSLIADSVCNVCIFSVATTTYNNHGDIAKSTIELSRNLMSFQ